MIVTDRDLLMCEPCLFTEITFASQTIVKEIACAFSNEQIITSAIDFRAKQITVGHVVLLETTPFEVISVPDSHTIGLSYLRNSSNDEPLEIRHNPDTRFTIRTYGPQIQSACNDIFNILIGHSASDEKAKNSLIHSYPDIIKELVVLSALVKIFQSAILLISEKSKTLSLKCQYYHDRLMNALQRVNIQVGTDDCGLKPQHLSAGTIHLKRF